MSQFSSLLRVVMLVAGVSMVAVGVASVILGGVTLAETREPVELTVVEGSTVPIPENSSFWGGSVMVYTAAPAEESPNMLGCELVEADGDVASATRIGDFDRVLGEPVMVDGTTWYPFTEIEVRSEEATLSCSGDTLSSTAVSEQTTFGRSATFIGLIALGAGVAGLVLGSGALIVAWVVRR